MSYRLKFDPDKCVGCYACHIACLDAHHDVEDVDAKSLIKLEPWGVAIIEER